MSFKIPKETSESFWNVFEKWDGVANREEHLVFLELTEAYFLESRRRITVGKLLRIVEKQCSLYSQAMRAVEYDGRSIGLRETEWEWNTYNGIITSLFERIGLEDLLATPEVQSVIAYNYLQHLEPIVAKKMTAIVFGIFESSLLKNKRIEDVDSLLTEEYYRFMFCQEVAVKISIIEDMKNLFTDQIPKNVQNDIDTMLRELRNEYSEQENSIIITDLA